MEPPSKVVAADASKAQRQPRLRSSCDACGAAKLKCSRGQPKCARCINCNLDCQYGVSRKKGRPQRDKPRSLPTQLVTIDEANISAGAAHHDRSASLSDADTSFSWDTAPGHLEEKLAGADGVMVDLDNGFDPNASSLVDLTYFRFDNWPLAGQCDNQSIIPAPSPLTEDAISSSSQSPLGMLQQQASLQAGAGESTHHEAGEVDCSRKVHNILDKLSVESASRSLFGQTPPGSAAPGDSSSVPLDHILHLNRTAIECLTDLLACACATTPNMILLFAANLYRIMSWYHQVATSSIVSDQGAGARPETLSWAATNLSAVTVTPVRTAIGSFSVDDLRLQTSMKIQLILGEMKRLGRLVNVFIASHGLPGGQFAASDRVTLSGPGNPYQGFDTWLETEHSRIVEALRSQLRELDAAGFHDVPMV